LSPGDGRKQTREKPATRRRGQCFSFLHTFRVHQIPNLLIENPRFRCYATCSSETIPGPDLSRCNRVQRRAVNVESQQEIEQEVPEVCAHRGSGTRQANTYESRIANAKRKQAVEAFATLKGTELVRRSETLFFQPPDKKFRVCCVVSKRYDSDYQPLDIGMRTIPKG